MLNTDQMTNTLALMKREGPSIKLDGSAMKERHSDHVQRHLLFHPFKLLKAKSVSEGKAFQMYTGFSLPPHTR